MRSRCAVLFAVLALAFTLPAGAVDLPDRPLTLAECLSLAKLCNPSLVIARQEVVRSEAGVQGALSAYTPNASLVLARGRTGGTIFVDTVAGVIPVSTLSERREADVVISQTVWELGRKESVRGAKFALGASRASEQAAWQDLALSVSQRYYAALAAEQLVGVAQATLAAAKDHEKLVKARAQVGEGAPVDVAPAEADVANAEFSVLQAENDAALAKAQLKREMGVSPTYNLRVAPPESAVEVAPLAPLSDDLKLALQGRPELLAARDSIAASQQELHVAKTLEYGTIAVTGQYDRGLTGPSDETSWLAVVSATAFLFDGGGRAANTQAARANLCTVQAQEQQLVNAIGLEVESARLDVETARKSAQSAQKAVTSAQAQLAAAEGKYKEGVGIFVEILDAQQTVARARTNSVRARYDLQTALVALRRATGQLTFEATK